MGTNLSQASGASSNQENNIALSSNTGYKCCRKDGNGKYYDCTNLEPGKTCKEGQIPVPVS